MNENPLMTQITFAPSHDDTMNGIDWNRLPITEDAIVSEPQPRNTIKTVRVTQDLSDALSKLPDGVLSERTREFWLALCAEYGIDASDNNTGQGWRREQEAPED